MRHSVAKLSILVVIVALALPGLACKLPLVGKSDPSSPPAGAQALPRAWIESPAQGDSLPLGQVTVVYHAGGEAGFTQVELSVNGEVKSIEAAADPSATEAGYEYNWQPSAPGSYILAVRAQGASGGWSDLARVTVRVVENTPETAAVNSQPTDEPPAPTHTAAPTWTMAPTITPAPTETAAPSVTPTAGETRFEVKLSTQKAYIGACSPNEVKFAVSVFSPSHVNSVIVFFKFENLATGEKTAWDDGTAFNSTGAAGSGQFERKFATSSLVGSASGSYRVYYQIVATDNQNQVIQRSSTYSDLTIEKCP